MGEPTFHAEKTACYQLQQQTKVHVLALAWQTSLKNCTKSTQWGCSTQNRMILLSAHELVLPPLVHQLSQ